MQIRQRLLLLLTVLALLFFTSAHEGTAAAINRDPIGKGSLPSRLFSDGTVCLVDSEKPSACSTPLIKIPRAVTKAHSATFYGVFDLDGDGSPEVFLDYWSPFSRKDTDNVVLLVFKKIRGKYRRYLRLKAESYGYNPGAWFLDEPPYARAIFMSRCGGSSGSGLFYLNLKKKSLDLISGSVFLEGPPEFLDLDRDGIAEIFLPGRGRDRTSQPGAAVLHWRQNGYEIWWPDWEGVPTVIHAALADADGDGNKEILAVLDPEQAHSDKCIDGKTLCSRRLSVWKVEKEGITLISTTKLPDARYSGEPRFSRLPPFSPSIELDYFQTIGCTLLNGEMTCRAEK